MEYRHKEALRKSRIFLVENVIFPDIVDHVIDQDIFSESMLDHIKAGGDRVECIRQLLDYLNRRPDNCYNKFLTALTNSGHQHCAEMVEKMYVLSGPTQISEAQNPVPNPSAASFHYQNPEDDDPMEEELNPSGIYSSIIVQTSGPGYPSCGFPETEFASMRISESYPVQESSAEGSSWHHIPPVSPPVSPQTSTAANSEPQLSPPVSFVRPPSGGNFSKLTAYQLQIFSNQDNVYRMDSVPRGFVLVINNEEFNAMPSRPGSQKDQESLHYMFQLLGFKISHEKDKTAEEMFTLLKTFARYPELKNVDALAVVILSHGGQNGVIYGKDGSHIDNRAMHYITDEIIQKVFSSRNCPLMANKPKLFIIQACRGKNEDMPESDLNRERPTVVPGAVGFQNDSGSGERSASSSSGSSRVANMADMCLIHSTVQGYVSYRHPHYGSPFVEELTTVFNKKASTESLSDMMAEVARQLANRPLPENLRTVPSTTNTLTKRWFFNPPHSDPNCNF